MDIKHIKYQVLAECITKYTKNIFSDSRLYIFSGSIYTHWNISWIVCNDNFIIQLDNESAGYDSLFIGITKPDEKPLLHMKSSKTSLHEIFYIINKHKGINYAKSINTVISEINTDKYILRGVTEF